jgi:hypothetical protein|uniref:Uncharacterized protein n=1 Tax=viral metagenome TaxID=1070528 RepID=A0A6C0IMA4_9ZZZZ
MVLSTTKKTASISSITNQNQGGGSKKSGLPKQLRDSWTSIALHGRTNYGENMTMPLASTTSISRPIGSTQSGNVYFKVA